LYIAADLVLAGLAWQVMHLRSGTSTASGVQGHVPSPPCPGMFTGLGERAPCPGTVTGLGERGSHLIRATGAGGADVTEVCFHYRRGGLP
jgi:hypothetical protein